MSEKEIKQYLKNNIKIKLKQSGSYIQIELYIENELITKTESVKV